MKAYILINVHPGEIREVVRQLRSVENVTKANMTFGPYDVVAEVDSEDVNHLGRILSNTVLPIPGIRETLTCLAVEI